jgi:hypothetical protein
MIYVYSIFFYKFWFTTQLSWVLLFMIIYLVHYFNNYSYLILSKTLKQITSIDHNQAHNNPNNI